jgi:hypothetical protein
LKLFRLYWQTSLSNFTMDIRRLLNTPPPEILETPAPSPPRTPKNPRAADLTRSDRIRIKTALDFRHNPKEIAAKYPYTLRQIQ